MLTTVKPFYNFRGRHKDQCLAGAGLRLLLQPADHIIGHRADGALAVIQNSATEGRVAVLQSSDGWLTASVAAVSSHEGQATTGAAVGEAIFSVQPHFNDAEAPSIHRAEF